MSAATRLTLPGIPKSRFKPPELPTETDERRSRYSRKAEGAALLGPIRLELPGFCRSPASIGRMKSTGKNDEVRIGYWSHRKGWEDVDDMGGCILPLD